MPSLSRWTLLALCFLSCWVELAAGCGSGAVRACVPGASVVCACSDGKTGAQTCNGAGAGYSPCVCDSGAGTAGTSGGGTAGGNVGGTQGGSRQGSAGAVAGSSGSGGPTRGAGDNDSGGVAGIGSGGSAGTAGTPDPNGGSGSAKGGTVGSGGVISGQDGGNDASCETATFKLEAHVPTVYVLVDRSGSMFHCLSGNTSDVVCPDMTNTPWYTYKTAIESVLTRSDAHVRFGFTTVYGTNPAGGGTCPPLDGVLTDNIAPALNNATIVASRYDGLAFPPNSTQVGVKFQGPSSESISAVTQALLADPDPGDKYILFVSDGRPDYCDDSNSLCAPDSVIWKLQTAYAAGITTLVFGVQTPLFDEAPNVLQGFANAGVGEPTLAPLKPGGTSFDFYDQCDAVAGWASDLKTKGTPPMRGDTLGTYSSTTGPAVTYEPTESSESQLVSRLNAPSCSYAIPSPLGASVDFGKVNLQLTNGVGMVTTIEHRNSGAECTDGGWYYNVAPSAGMPTQIIICPSTCSQFQADAGDGAQIALGCATVR